MVIHVIIGDSPYYINAILILYIATTVITFIYNVLIIIKCFCVDASKYYAFVFAVT